MTAAASTPKTLFLIRKTRAPISRLLSFIALMSLFLTPVQSAHAAAPHCTPPKGHFGNFQSVDPALVVPEVPFLDGTGKEVSLASYKGKGIILNFWATWCAPCVREMPQLDRLSAFVKDNNIEVLTVSEDRNGLVSAPKFYKTHNLNDLPVLVDPKGRLMRAFSAPGLPLTVFINADGLEIARVVGPAEWDSTEIVEFVRSCLAGPSSASG